MALQVSPSTLEYGENLSVTLNWENDIIGNPPLNIDDPKALSVELITPSTGNVMVLPQEWQTSPTDENGQGRTTFTIPSGKNIPDGFVELRVTPLHPGGTQSPVLSAEFYLIGKEYHDFTNLLQQARQAFETADNMTCEEAYKLHFGTTPPAYYPDNRAPEQFTDFFGAKYNILEGEKLLKGATRNAALLKSIPAYTADLNYRLEQLRKGAATKAEPATGIQWRSYVSELDGTRQPYTVAVPREYNAEKSWPLIIDLHGYGGGWSQRPDNGKVLAAQTMQCLLARPYLRGGTWYRSWGESEAMQLIENLCQEYNIATNRIHVTGFSMGGSGAMHLLATYPDIFASGGGSSGRAEPLKGWSTTVTPFWTADGFKDQGTTWTGGRMFTLHAAAAGASSARHRGDGFAGHYYNLEPQTLYGWMLAHPKIETPRHLSFGIWSARTASLRWVRKVEPLRYGRFAQITADCENNGTIRLDTDNVAGLKLELPDSLVPATIKELNVIWNGIPFKIARDNGLIGSSSKPRPAYFKDPGNMAGPLDDFLIKRFVIVQSSNMQAADSAVVEKNIASFNQRWHNYYQGKLEYYTEKTIPRQSLENENMLCVGTVAPPSIWPADQQVPIYYAGKWLQIGQKRIPAKGSSFVYLARNPLNVARYMVVVGAEDPQNIGRALAQLFSQTMRHFDFVVVQPNAERSTKISARTDDFARLNNLAAFGWFDWRWQINPKDKLLPDGLFMDNQNPGLVLTPDGNWRDDVPLTQRLREE
jgi:pimeloyl-ACP methyl ester carboxylesterase